MNYDWLKEHVAYVGDGCLTWPFSRDRHGYGNVKAGDSGVSGERD